MKSLLGTTLFASGAYRRSLAVGPSAASARASAPATINLRWAAQALAWSALLVITLWITLMLQALAVNTREPSRFGTQPTTCRTLSPLTAALEDGDDVRASFLARLAA